jgi:hypothetical protein
METGLFAEVEASWVERAYRVGRCPPSYATVRGAADGEERVQGEKGMAT